ncbi:MAG: YggT family protein [Desulfovibrio sp.]|jgi:YggT family protein|nr:YggT family protein [Desulfovibrio sp.]
MFIFANILEAVVYVVDMTLSLYSFIVIAACLISWVNPDPYNPVVRTLRNLTEPLLWRIRKYLPFTYTNGLDFSPVVLLLAVQLVKMVIVKSLLQAIHSM